MRCLITGVAGFIGSHLAEALLAEGHEVWGLDNFSGSYARIVKENNLAGVRGWGRFHLVEMDLLTGDLLPLLDGVDWVFHLAARDGVRASWGQDLTDYLDTNVLGTRRLLDAVVRLQSVRRFIYASSSAVYGEVGHIPLSETLRPQPHSPYGMSKLAAEQLCLLYRRNFGLPTVILRYFTVYGPRQRPDMALQRFCQAALAREPLSVYGDGTQRRDFTFISDVIDATLLAATSIHAPGGVFNIGSGVQATLRDIFILLEEISETHLLIDYQHSHYGDVSETLADIGHARQMLGYRPQVSLRMGLARQFSEMVDLYARAGGSLVV